MFPDSDIITKLAQDQRPRNLSITNICQPLEKMGGLEIPVLVVGILGAAAGIVFAYKDMATEPVDAYYKSVTATKVRVPTASRDRGRTLTYF
jgi:hypothetical protein